MMQQKEKRDETRQADGFRRRFRRRRRGCEMREKNTIMTSRHHAKYVS